MNTRIVFNITCALVLFTNSLGSMAASPPLPEWTLLVYLNGHNNLDQFGDINLNQMEQVGSTDRVKVVVQWASLKEGTTKRLLMKKDYDTHQVTSPVIQDLGRRADMGSAQTLEDFLKWGMKTFPAKHTFAVVWNHGSGWRKLGSFLPGYKDPLLTREISSDDVSGNIITTEQLGAVLVRVSQKMRRKIDIVGADACLMAMAEVVGEFAHSASYFVASQELEPGRGWPYADFLARWNEMSSRTPANVSRALVDTYAASYSGGSNGRQEVTLSALDLSKWPAFTAASKRFALSSLYWTVEEKRSALLSTRQSLNFYYPDYVDLGDWLNGIAFSTEKAPLLNALSELVIANGVTPEYRRASGLSVWVPPSDPTLRRYLTRYGNLAWDQRALWSTIAQGIHGLDTWPGLQ